MKFFSVLKLLLGFGSIQEVYYVDFFVFIVSFHFFLFHLIIFFVSLSLVSVTGSYTEDEPSDISNTAFRCTKSAN